MRKRIAIGLLLWMVVMLLVFGGTVYYLLLSNMESLVKKRLAMAKFVKEVVENTFMENINRLLDISNELAGGIGRLDGGRLGLALSNAYSYSIFSDGIFVLDSRKKQVLSYPTNTNIPFDPKLVNVNKFEKVRIMEVIVKDNFYLVFVSPIVVDRELKYYVVGVSNPTNPVFLYRLAINSVGDVDRNVKIEMVDSSGRIIVSSDPQRTLRIYDHKNFFAKLMLDKKIVTTSCHECHFGGKKTSEVLIFVPMQIGTFGIVWREPKSVIMAPLEKFGTILLGFTMFCLFISHILIVGLGKSVVDPIRRLITVANRIATGDLTRPVVVSGFDEIVALGRAFETMRLKLLELIEHIKRENELLEERVREKTAQIMEDQKRIKYLLDKILKAQEEERRRIARELHDDTMQRISSVIMRMDMCKLNPEKVTPEKIEELQNMLRETWESIRMIIRNLRPPLLDDFGLIPAIEWLIKEMLEKNGISVSFTHDIPEGLRFDKSIENEVFRVVQEAFNNIVKHSKATNVCVRLKLSDGKLIVSIRDNGVGFDVSKFSSVGDKIDESMKGFGILSMYERINILGGRLILSSKPGKGTIVYMAIPVAVSEVESEVAGRKN